MQARRSTEEVAGEITVTGIDDFVVDGDQPYFIRTNSLVSLDLGYHGLDPPDVSVVNLDND